MNEMTAEEYFKEKFKGCTIFEKEIFKIIQDFTRLKCKEQRELCAKEIKRNAVIFDILGINQETILNSPEPEI